MLVEMNAVEVASLANEAAEAIERHDIGDAEKIIQDIIRFFWRKEHRREESAYRAIEHLAARNYGKARKEVLALAVGLGASLLIEA
jgi:hypothetical protein